MKTRVAAVAVRGVTAVPTVLMALAVMAGLLSAGPIDPGRAASGRAGSLRLQAAAEPGTRLHNTRGRSRSKAPLALVLDKVPTTVRQNAQITVYGHVQNLTGQQITGASVRLRWRSRPVNGRTELDELDRNGGSALMSAGPVKPLAGALAPGRSVRWQLTTSARMIGMRTFGVYPIAVDVVNLLGQTVVSQTTFLVFMPNAQALRPKPTRVAWIWPMVDRPRRLNDTTFLDDGLETELASTGRLGELAEVVRTTRGARSFVTWAIDPALLDDAREMTKGYTVDGGKDGKALQRPASKVAQMWLNAVKATGGPYFTLPYADPDAVALIRQRMGLHLKIAYGGMGVAREILGRPPVSAIGWPVDGVAGQQTLDGMAANGTRTFLMSSEVLPGREPHGYTTNATTTLQTSSDTRRTLVYDATIANVISADTRRPGAALLAEQRFLAETAMITAETPSVSRTLVIAPQRRWDPKPAFAKDLLKFTAGASWLQGIQLSDVQRARPVQRTFTGYPVGYERYELGATHLAKVREIAARATHFADIFEQPSNAYERSVLRMESTYWRGRDRRARNYRQQVAASLDSVIKQVHLVPNKRIGLAGDSGFIPVTVANDLRDRTVNVILRVTSQNPRRLEIGGGTRAGNGREWWLKISPGDKETVKMPVEINANGYTVVALELLTPKRRGFGEDRTITVHTTGYARTALIITGSALAVLFIGIGMRVLRARRRNRAEESDGAGSGGHTGG